MNDSEKSIEERVKELSLEVKELTNCVYLILEVLKLEGAYQECGDLYYGG